MKLMELSNADKMKGFKKMKYNYYSIFDKETGKEIGVVCTATYAGKTVRGISKCNPVDVFDYEKGKDLATARCYERIMYKRALAMERKLQHLDEEIARLEKYRKSEEEYYDSIVGLYEAALDRVVGLEDKMN